MPHNLLKPAIFFLGLAALCWIGVGYLGTSTLALAVVLLITACFVAGALELRRYDAATRALVDAVAALTGPVPSLADWLDTLPASLRQAVRQRVEGDRVPLPAPALTSFLVGLLVLLGMLGTLLGMMTTLRGTGLALESASDLEAIRTSLAAPVKGLAFAFGTSIAGVAASAMLGLLSALCRRERAEAVLRLDAAIATTLHGHSRAYQREAAFGLLQRQVDTMPVLVEQLRAMMVAIEQQSLAAHGRQLDGQVAFFERTEAAQARLATSIASTLEASAADSARAAGAALQPIAEATMAGLAQQAATLHGQVGQAMERQLTELSDRMSATTSAVAGLWTQAVADQRHANDQAAHQLTASLEQFTGTFDQRSSALVHALATRLEAAGDATTTAWRDALAGQAVRAEALADRHAQAFADAAARFEDANERASLAWDDVLARQAAQAEALARNNEQALTSAAASFESHAAALVETVQHSHAQLQAKLEAQTHAQARATLTEIARLVQDAAEAPKAAAAVISELREHVSANLVRDNAMLEERGRLLGTVETLLGAVNHASAEQRAAIDALINTSADALERVAARLSDQVDAQAGRLDGAADRVAAGAIEVASLGDVFSASIERFGEANQQLAERLQAIEGVLEQSMARSDEQLAYYVAQARDVVDLSVLTQKQIISELQRLADSRIAGVEPA